MGVTACVGDATWEDNGQSAPMRPTAAPTWMHRGWCGLCGECCHAAGCIRPGLFFQKEKALAHIRFLTEQISPSQNAPLRGSWCADDFGRVGGGRSCTSPGLRFVWVIIDNARNDGRHGRGTVTGWPTERFPARSERSYSSEHPAGAGEQVPAAWLARAAALCRCVCSNATRRAKILSSSGGVGGAWARLERP